MPEILWNRMTARSLRERAAQGAPVLLPVGATEQHGPHLPTGVDDLLSAEACRRVAALLTAQGQPVVVAPSVWCGLSDHHIEFGGTFSLSLPTYHALLRDLCRSIITAGFSRILIVNGHAGNMMALNAISTELFRELSVPIAVTSYFAAAQERTAEILETQDTLMHACEGETSMVMAVAPDLVDRSELGQAHGPRITLPSDPHNVFQIPRSFAQITSSGMAGDARSATATKGEAILDASAQAIADWLLKWISAEQPGKLDGMRRSLRQ
jgi:creatinine amidohydrolase